MNLPPPIRRAAWLSLSLLAPVPFLAAVAAVVLRPDLWVVEHVRVEGAEKASHAALRHLMDLPNGTHVLRADPGAVARNVERHPWVASAEAHWEFPATVVVQVSEHQPTMILAGDPMRYVDSQGEIFAIATTDDLDYPVLSGIGSELEVNHPGLPGKVVQSALELYNTLASSGLVHAGEIGEIAFSANRGFTVYLRGGAEILFDLQGFERQVGRLGRVVRDGVRLDRPVHVDLALPSMAIVRPPSRAEVSGEG